MKGERLFHIVELVGGTLLSISGPVLLGEGIRTLDPGKIVAGTTLTAPGLLVLRDMSKRTNLKNSK